jgi:hypothetical protein
MGRVDDSFIQYLTDQLSDWATITARRMFGGWGIYRGALMFAIVQDDQLYLKCGDALRSKADGAELTLFTYEKPAKTKEKGPPKPPKAKEPISAEEADEDDTVEDDNADEDNDDNDRKVTLNFALIDADTIEDSEALCLWADCAWQDALSAQRTKSATQTHGAQPSSSKRQGLGRRGTPSS